jgi:peptide/nickel transport system permease protein
LVAFLAPLIAPYDPLTQHVGNHLSGPSTSFWLGTDNLSRDTLSRLLYGARTSLLVVAPAVFGGAGVGTMLGASAGFFGGLWEAIVGRLTDLLLAYPSIILGLLVVAMLGPGSFEVGLAIAVFNVPIFARISRGSALSEKHEEYVIASECTGASPLRTLFRHVLPNIMSPIGVQLIISLGFGVVMESALSFLGLGVQPPSPSWGTMLSDGKQYLRDVPVLGVAPGVMLASFVLGMNLFADGLRQSKQRGVRQ